MVHDQKKINQLQTCIEDNICKLCSKEPETLLHALRDCTQCSPIWKRLVRRSEWWDFSIARSTQEWIDFNLHNSREASENNLKWSILFKEVVNSVWYQRNLQIHNEEASTPTWPFFIKDILYRVDNSLIELYDSKLSESFNADKLEAAQGSHL